MNKNYPYSFVLWNIDTNDWRYHNVEYLTNYILDNVADGNVILMHDSYESTVQAALRIVDLLTAEGYEFVTVDELILE